MSCARYATRPWPTTRAESNFRFHCYRGPGLEGFEASGFVGVAGPAGMPRPAVARLEAAVGWAMRETDLPRLYEEQGLLARYAGAEGFAALIARDRERWARVVREAGITPG